MSVVCPNGHSSESQDYCDTCGAAIDLAAQPAAPPSAGAPDPDTDPDAAGTPRASHLMTCPHCATDNAPESLFCEACGYDFTTGAMPRGSQAAPAAPEVAAAEAASGMPAATDPQPAAGEPASAAEGTAAEGTAAEGTAAEGTAAEGTGIPEPESARAEAPAAPAGPANAPAADPATWVAEIWIDPEWYAVQEAEEPMPSPGLPTVVPLGGRSALIGRVSASRNIHPDVDCTSDSGVSRRHAQLTTDGTRWFVEDLGSSNGTFVGGIDEPLPEHPITVGPKRELATDDRVYVGAWTRIVVRPATEEERAAAAGATS